MRVCVVHHVVTCVELVTWLISHTVPAIARSLYTSSLGFCLATLGLGIGIAVADANSSTSSETGPETGSGFVPVLKENITRRPYTATRKR